MHIFENLWFDRQGQPIDIAVYGELHGDRDYVWVAQDEVRGYRVSTVWLGMNHNLSGEGPPVIFETMIFPPRDEHALEGEEWDEMFMARYCTEEEALAGHAETVGWISGRLRDVLGD